MNRQARITGVFWLACVTLLIGVMTWALIHFWP